MPALLYAQGALDDLHRLSEFLQGEDSAAAGATAALVMRGLEILEAHPLIGRPIGAGLHELILSRGNTGYVAVYEYQPRQDRVLVLALRHQREAGFDE
jgi:plasmid stabilization system protein ParE